MALCRQVVLRAQHAVWAWKRLGILLLDQKEPAEAIPALQSALRAKPSDATTWEALGAAYQPLGRLTAALKAYTRAIELDPHRIYSLIQQGNLLLTLGDPDKALGSHEAALKLDSTHPAALLGAAEALTSSAGGYIQSGAVKAAGIELEKAAKYAKMCASNNSNLISAWKQLGDILLIARNAPFRDPSTLLPLSTTSLEENEATPETQEAVGVVLEKKWQQRITAVQHSRKTYTRALFLSPSASSAWHDVACTYYHESQLYRAHPSILTSSSLGPTKNKVENLLVEAERCVRGALRLHPASPKLWTALGIASTDRAVKEYALSRSLQLDPKSSTAWVALARLYIDANEPALAEKCLQQGRSQDPAVGLIWEAMASLAALSSTTSSAAEKDRIEFNQHAVELGATAEGLLGFAEASLLGKNTNSGKSSLAGSVYAAAHRAKELSPLNPAAINVWGLACEVKQDYLGAIKAYTACVDLLALTVGGTNSSGNNGAVLLHQQPATTRSGVPLVSGVKINLARALCSAEKYPEAASLYHELESNGVLLNQPSALLSYAIVKAQNGDLHGAEVTASTVLSLVGGDIVVDGSTAAAAVEILMELKIAAGQLTSAVDVLYDYVSQLNEVAAPVEEVMKLWLMAVAAVVSERKNETFTRVSIDQVISAAKSWAVTMNNETNSNAMFFAQLDAHRQIDSVSNLLKLVHLDPSALDLRLSLAAAASNSNGSSSRSSNSLETYTVSVLRLLQNMNITPSTTSTTSFSTGEENNLLLTTRLQIATSALLKRGLSSGLARIKHESRLAAEALHAQPENVDLWYVAALLATQVAVGKKTPHSWKKALTCSRCALTLLTAPSSQKVENNANELCLQQVRLLICISESLLQLKNESSEDHDQALRNALAAVDLSSKLSSSDYIDVKVDALRQVARCHWKHGDTTQAESLFRQAMEEANKNGGGDSSSGAIAAMELASCLRSCGRGRDASEVLNEHATSTSFSKIKILQQQLLQRTMLLARLGELDAAKACAEAATPEEKNSSSQSSSISSTRGIGLVAQGAVALQQALAVGAETETGVAFLSTSRRCLAESLQKGQNGVVSRALLAQIEYSGTNRKKEEKIQVHVELALSLAQRPISAELLHFLGKLDGSKTKLCAKALHAAPWKTNWWVQMQESR